MNEESGESALEETKVPLPKQDNVEEQVQLMEEKVEKIEDLDPANAVEGGEQELKIIKEEDIQQQLNMSEMQLGQNEVIHEQRGAVEAEMENLQGLHSDEEEQQPLSLEIQPIQNEILDEEKQIQVIDVNATEDQLDFALSLREGPVTPPPTPAITEDGSKLELCSSEHTEEAKLSKTQDHIKESLEPAKDKKQKKAGFKIDSKKDPLKGVEYGHGSKEETGMHSRDDEEEKRKAECTRYAGVEKFAGHFIDKIIDKSINSIATEQGMHLQELPQIDGEDISVYSSLRSFVEVYGSVIRWPRIHEFTREIGISMIDDYMQTWDYDEEWIYCIDFLLEQSDECSDYYLYEAKWSIPSKPYPIPQATASVYFTIEVSRVKPSFCPVDVTYVFEGSRLVHAAGKIPFQEHWLFSIINAKLELYRHIKF